jgi:hypothetical protein
LWRAERRLRDTPRQRVAWTQSLPWLAARQRRAPNPRREAARRARAGRGWFGFTVDNPLWLRARLTHVYDRFGSLRRLQWLGWTICVFGVTMLMIFNPNDLKHEGYSIAFQLPTWATTALVTTLVCGHSLIGDRRRGFLEQVIVTPMSGREIVDGTALALWEHLRRLLWLPAALAVFFWFTGASPVEGEWFAFGTAALFCIVLAWQSMACSLAARTTPGAVVSSFALPAGVIFLMPMTAISYRQNHAVALWIMIAIWFVVTAVWCWRRKNAASVGCFLTAVHLVLIALAEFWTYNSPDGQFPMSAMHPMFLIIASLVREERGGFGETWRQHSHAIVLCYWAALFVNIIVIRFWLIRRFDRLVERAESRDSPRTENP